MGKQTENDFERIAKQVSVISIIANTLLSTFKFIAGLVAHSSAMVSDAVHSASDVFSTFVVMIGVKLSSKESDKEHPYGHERLECVAAIILSMILFATGAIIGYKALMTIIQGRYKSLDAPDSLALIAAIISIAIKEAMYWYTKYYAKMIDSSALMADAWHHRSDALSSIGALIGIGGAMLGYPIMDSIASLIIFVFISKAAYDIFMDAVDKVVDHCCDEKTEKEIYNFVIQNSEVIAIDLIHTRLFGNKIYVDLEIELNGQYTLITAHEIAEKIHDDIEHEFPKVKHIMIHINPAKTTN